MEVVSLDRSRITLRSMGLSINSPSVSHRSIGVVSVGLILTLLSSQR
jgi:hypothetical protein